VLWYILIQSKDMKAGHAMILSNYVKIIVKIDWLPGSRSQSCALP